MPTNCQQLKEEYQALLAKTQEFKAVYKKALQSGDLTEAKKLKAQLERDKDELMAKIWPFEHLEQKEIEKEYNSQREILERNGLLETLSTGELGIKAIDNQEYPFPILSEVKKRLRQKREVIKTKSEQGFQKLLIVPFGLKLKDIIGKTGKAIIRHDREGKLLATKRESTDPDELLPLKEDKDGNKLPIFLTNQYENGNADASGNLVYFPEKYDPDNHGGKTKAQLLKESKDNGFTLMLIEDLPNIPRENKGKTIGGRKQIEAGKSPEEYLQKLQTDKDYQNESGLTPEDQLVYFLTHLEQTNQVIDDYGGNGSFSYQLGGCFPKSGNRPLVPCACWARHGRQLDLGRVDSGFVVAFIGARFPVRF